MDTKSLATLHISAENEKFAKIIEDANRISYGMVSPIIITVGLAGNLATLVTLADRRKFSGRIYAYLRALAVSDLICLIFAMTFVLTGKNILMIEIYFHSVLTYNKCLNCIMDNTISEYPLNFENGFTSGEVVEGETLYAAAFYSAHVENLIINGLFATSVFIVVSMTIDRYIKIIQSPRRIFVRVKY